MLDDLPDFDHLRKLAEENPEELDFLCYYFSKRLIDSAPENYQKRLKGIMFQLELTRRRSKNSLQSCVEISKLMMNSFTDLNDVLNNKTAGDSITQDNKDHSINKNLPVKCRILPFENC